MQNVIEINAEQVEKIRKTRKFVGPTLAGIDRWLQNSSLHNQFVDGSIVLLDELYNIMKDSQEETCSLIKADKKTDNKEQAIKSVAGNNFQAAVAYSLIKLQGKGEIPQNIAVVLNGPQAIKMKQQMEIVVSGITQKPDIDVLIFDPNNPNSTIVLLSIKTSFRERAGQTAKWKLLLDIARSDNCFSLKKQYGLDVNTEKLEVLKRVKFGFVSCDLYTESQSTQNRGFKEFFDFFYITRTSPNENKFSGFAGELRKLFREI